MLIGLTAGNAATTCALFRGEMCHGRPLLGLGGSSGSRGSLASRDCRRRGLKRSWLAIMPLPSVLKLGLILQQHLWRTDLRVRCFAPEKLLTSVQWATRFA